jgi:signal transduction histidine kinase
VSDVEPDLLPEAEPGRRGLRLGILVYRWASFVLTVILAVVVDLARPGLAWVALALLGAWIGIVTWIRAWDRPLVRWVDLFLSAGFLLLAPILAEPRSLAEQPFLGAAYPLASVLTWAADAGLGPGLAAAGVLAVPLALSRPLNDLPYSRLSGGEIAGVITMIVYYAFAAVTVGLFAGTLERAAADLRRANETAARERERAARLRERETLARTLHDSVLGSLALVRRTGRELASRPEVAGDEVAALVEVADREERALRALLQREPEPSPEGTVRLRTVLQTASSGISGVPVAISIVEPALVEAAAAEELGAAIRQALDNVVEHARATTVTLFGERDGRDLAISVRDDGIGFEVDDARLAADGKLGIAHSMRGRIEDLGGTMRIRSAPGAGTEVEFRLPAATPANGAATAGEGKEGR